MKTLTSHAKEITAFYYVLDEKVFVSASLDGFVKIHSDSLADKGQILHLFHMDQVNKRMGQWKPVRDTLSNVLSVRPCASSHRQRVSNAPLQKAGLLKVKGRRRTSSATETSPPVGSCGEMQPQKSVAQKKFIRFSTAHKLRNAPELAKITDKLSMKCDEDTKTLIADFDITVMALSHELGVIATTGQSQAVCMWDCQTCHYISVLFWA